jgi:hypothetical protein
MLPQIPKQNKYYFDQTVYPNAEALAHQAQGLFPSIRFGVGSSLANANFSGDESAILAALSLPPPPLKAPIKAPMHFDLSHAQEKNADMRRSAALPVQENSSLAEPVIEYNEGDIVLVTSLGIEGKIKSVLPRGLLNVELTDGITETVLAKNVVRVQRASETAKENTPPPAEAKENTPPPAETKGNAPPPAAAKENTPAPPET